jgi:hypothetical protein
LACLFSPKVYIILLHPEKNMRLTKQLKAQANSLKFASQIATKTNFISNHHVPNYDLSSSDGPAQTIVSNDHEENYYPLVSKPIVTFKSIPNNCENNEKITNNQQKVPTIIMTSHSERCLNHEKHKLKNKKYNSEDEDSLNSNPIQDDGVML